jgi:hypothetical protein
MKTEFRKVIRNRRNKEKWFVHKATTEDNKRKRVDHEETLTEWCIANEKGEFEMEVKPHPGSVGLRKAWFAELKIGDDTWVNPHACKHCPLSLPPSPFLLPDTLTVLFSGERAVAP